jgi:hypothetical protein
VKLKNSAWLLLLAIAALLVPASAARSSITSSTRSTLDGSHPYPKLALALDVPAPSPKLALALDVPAPSPKLMPAQNSVS